MCTLKVSATKCATGSIIVVHHASLPMRQMVLCTLLFRKHHRVANVRTRLGPFVMTGYRMVAGVMWAPHPLTQSPWTSFSKMGQSDNHYFCTTDKARMPVRYMEHKDGQLKQWDFQMTTFVPYPSFSKDTFSPPADCDQKCDASFCV